MTVEFPARYFFMFIINLEYYYVAADLFRLYFYLQFEPHFGFYVYFRVFLGFFIVDMFDKKTYMYICSTHRQEEKKMEKKRIPVRVGP